EMALGNALQNIVSKSEEDAKNAIAYLKEHRLGRATFLPISSIRPRYIEKHLIEDLKRITGFCGVASDLLQYGPELEGIVGSLLGRVVVVDNLDIGIRVAKMHSYSFRLVTLEGDLINTSGSMTGGSMDNQSGGILSRANEILRIREEIGNLVADEQRDEASVAEIIPEMNRIASELVTYQSSLRDTELAIVKEESLFEQLKGNILKVQSKRELHRNEKEQLLIQADEMKGEIEEAGISILQIEEEMFRMEKEIEENRQKHLEGRSLRDELHNYVTDYKISVNSIIESMENIREALDKLTDENESIQRAITRKKQEKTHDIEEIKTLKEKNEGLEKVLAGLDGAKTGKNLEMDRLAEEQKIISEELVSLTIAAEEAQNSINLQKEDYSRIELKRVKVEAELDVVQNRLWDEYQLTFTDALELKKDIGGLAKAQKSISEYKEAIRALGPVNMAAIEDYIKTKERYEFMKEQHGDLEKSAEKLHRVIHDMASIMKKQFLEKFRQINESFNKVFRELFEGGKAELKLLDENNILECGIDIEVQPPGKKLQNMQLLSGGEKAFVAIALLFSILRLRPAPFCILDEIEAALDDANVSRFSKYVDRLSERTQFVLITHRKGTMEASNSLYGVTMQERGISRIVSITMKEGA
ncbi:MAG: chromosome segregation protein SMC, partial [Clostridiales bacterium]|nr:chromosome segregation protein SMC [Clostridiales bacterium]